MSVVLVLLLALAEIGGGFGGPAVTGTEATAATMEIDVSVVLDGSDGPVVVHLALPGETTTRPLVNRNGETWGALLEVRRADWQIVFEDVATGEISNPLSLTELGLDPALLGSLPGGTPPGERDTATTSMAWGWLAAAVLAGGGAIALASAGRRKPRHLRRRRTSRHTTSGS
jgi:hypothetical protein